VTIGRPLDNPYHNSSASNVTLHGVGAVIAGGAQAAITVIDGTQVVVDGFTVSSLGVGVNIVRGTDITVRNVTVQSAGSDGIRADTVTDVTIVDNRVESAGGTGINVRATTSEIFGPLTVSSNTVLAAGGDGIFVHNIGDGADTVISENVVANVDGRGIRSECGMTLLVEHNDVRATGQTAVSVEQVYDRVTVSQNAISDAGGAGVDVHESSWNVAERVDISDNRIDRTGGDGVALVAPDVHVDRNVITGSGRAGIRVANSNFDRGTIYGSPVPDTSISENVVTRPGGSGIVLDHALPIDVTDNTINDPGTHGIELDGARGVTVTGNEVTGAASCGFRLENGARRNVLAGNTATDCTPGLWAPGTTRKKNHIAGTNHFRRHSRR
jgi:parallel beta-helix repeat protein